MRFLPWVIFVSLFSFQALAQEPIKKPAATQKTSKKVDAPADEPAPPKRRDPLMLTAEEQKILNKGEIQAGQHIAGGLVGTVVGFGLGHAIEGFYLERGWIFTVGEFITFALFIDGIGDGLFEDDEEADNKALFGFLGFFGLRLWEIVDVWWGPSQHNNQYRQIKSRIDHWNMQGYLMPTRDGATVGLRLSF